jgi:hypothetical protein
MAGTIDDNDQIHDLAIQALQAMLAKFGPEHRFPPDAMWEFVPGGVEILSTKKPHQPKRLVKEDYCPIRPQCSKPKLINFSLLSIPSDGLPTQSVFNGSRQYAAPGPEKKSIVAGLARCSRRYLDFQIRTEQKARLQKLQAVLLFFLS